MHDEGVWSLAVDDDFLVFYSGGRDKRVCATELTPGVSIRLSLMHTRTQKVLYFKSFPSVLECLAH